VITLWDEIGTAFATEAEAQRAIETSLLRFPAGYRFEIRRCSNSVAGVSYRVAVFADAGTDAHGPQVGWAGN